MTGHGEPAERSNGEWLIMANLEPERGMRERYRGKDESEKLYGL